MLVQCLSELASFCGIRFFNSAILKGINFFNLSKIWYYAIRSDSGF